MIAKQLFGAIVALSILFLPFSVVAADKNTMWQQLIEQEGCLLSSTDINYTISGSVFEKKLWKSFLNYAQNNKAVFYLIVNKFGSRKATKLHICNFRNATEGEVAVFVVQRIVGKNWYSYDGNNDKLKVIAQKKAAARPAHRAGRSRFAHMRRQLRRLRKARGVTLGYAGLPPGPA